MNLPHPDDAGQKRFQIAATVVVALAAFACYARTIGWGLIDYDDPTYVLENPHVLTGLSLDNLRWAFTTGHAANWHPLTWLSLQLDATLWGSWYGGFHLTSALLHAAASALVFWFWSLAAGAPRRAAAVALLFAVHPAHIESVAWVTERKDVLSTTLGLASLIAFVAFARRGGAWRYALSMALLALGLMAKPMLVTWPFVMLLLDLWPLRRWGLLPGADAAHTVPARRLILEKIPMLALVAAFCAVTVWAQKQATIATELVPMSDRVANAVVSIARYLSHTFLPQHAACFYPRQSWAAWQVGGSALLVAGLTWAAWRRRATMPYLLIGWLWFLGTLVPVIGLLQVGLQSLANRYLYVPHIGLLMALAWLIADVPAVASRARLAWALTLGVAALLAVQTARLLPAWRDSLLLWEHTAAATGNNPGAVHEVGAQLLERKRYDEAIEKFREVLRAKPDEVKAMSHLGAALVGAGRPAEAVAPLEAARAREPGYALGRVNLAAAYSAAGRHADAASELREAIRLGPATPALRLRLGDELAASDNLPAAEETLAALTRDQPNLAPAHNSLGIVRARRGDLAGAAAAFERAAALDPSASDARDNLARVRAMLAPRR